MFPNFNYLTPENFGEENSQAIIGTQMAFSYMGIMLAPALCGLLGQAFSMGFIPGFIEGEAARERWNAPEGGLLFLPESGLLYRVSGGALPPLEPFILADEALTRTLVATGRPGAGPYYRESSASEGKV